MLYSTLFVGAVLPVKVVVAATVIAVENVIPIGKLTLAPALAGMPIENMTLVPTVVLPVTVL